MSVVETVLAGLFGTIAGSFLSTVAMRWKSLNSMLGRSRCDLCDAVIPPWDNIPLVSFVALSGRCRSCRETFSFAHIGMEIICAAIGCIALATLPGVEGWSAAFFGWVLALLALIDAREQRLPDMFVLPLGGVGLMIGVTAFLPPMASRIAGALAGFASLWVIARVYRTLRGREGIGRGDAKLLGAIGAWVGWQDLPRIVLAGAILGLAWTALRYVRGHSVTATDRLPLGTLLAPAAWASYVFASWERYGFDYSSRIALLFHR